MLKNLKNNENGLVFVTILMIVAVIMTITIGIISLNVSQVTFTETEIQRVKTEMLSQGMIAYAFANLMSASAGNMSTTETIDGVVYTVTADATTSTGSLQISIVY